MLVLSIRKNAKNKTPQLPDDSSVARQIGRPSGRDGWVTSSLVTFCGQASESDSPKGETSRHKQSQSRNILPNQSPTKNKPGYFYPGLLIHRIKNYATNVGVLIRSVKCGAITCSICPNTFGFAATILPVRNQLSLPSKSPTIPPAS